jgi:hypothetical protein
VASLTDQIKAVEMPGVALLHQPPADVALRLNAISSKTQVRHRGHQCKQLKQQLLLQMQMQRRPDEAVGMFNHEIGLV